MSTGLARTLSTAASMSGNRRQINVTLQLRTIFDGAGNNAVELSLGELLSLTGDPVHVPTFRFFWWRKLIKQRRMQIWPSIPCASQWIYSKWKCEVELIWKRRSEDANRGSLSDWVKTRIKRFSSDEMADNENVQNWINQRKLIYWRILV